MEINSEVKIPLPSIVTLSSAFFRNTLLADRCGEGEEMGSVKPVDIVIFSGHLTKKDLGIDSVTIMRE